VRLSLARGVFGLALGAILLLAGPVRAQNPDTMDPEASAAKAREIIKQLIQATGGQAYLNAKSIQCDGRRAAFGHNGQLMGYVDFKDVRLFPDQRRIDFGKKGNIIDLFNGDTGWTLDRGGVSEEPAPAVADFEEAMKRDIHNLLRLRINEDRILMEYRGSAVVDLRFSDWVEITDADERKFRLAVDRSTHLLVRSIVITKDDQTGDRTEEASIYTNFQPAQGIELPRQVTREKDGHRTSQTFYDSCTMNPQIPADYFTKEALQQRFKEVGKPEKPKKNEEKPRID
jgi:hypothetical protein